MIACVVGHSGKKIFEIDPDSFVFNPKLFMVKTAAVSSPVQCHHCENPACMSACAEKAITIVNGAVAIDEKKCIGCKDCMLACPFGAVELVEMEGHVKNPDGSPRKIANKCDLCANIPGGPNCVKVCPTDALSVVTEEVMEESIAAKRIAAVGFK
jgi:electron transport protein HydN